MRRFIVDYGVGWIVLGIIIGITCVGGVIWLVKEDMADEAKEDANTARQFILANTICGVDNEPKSIETHNASWSYGRWIEVHCKDGTVRAIQGKVD